MPKIVVSMADLVGRHVVEVLPPGPAHYYRILSRVDRDDGTVEIEYEILRGSTTNRGLTSDSRPM